MIISISGTHCTGKSTLVELLKKHPVFQNAVFLKSSGRALAKENPRIKVNEDGDFFTQFYQMTRDCNQLLEAMDKPLVVCDRSYLDTLVYSQYLYEKGKISIYQMDLLKRISQVMSAMVHFDKVFLWKPSFELQAEENRSMNEEFQRDIYNMFDALRVHEPDWEYLPDDNELRINRIVAYVQRKKK